MQSHSATTFPLIESVVTVGNAVAGGDAAANSGGGSLTSTSTGNHLNDEFQLKVPGAGLDVALAGGTYTCYYIACYYAGDSYAALNFPERATSDLSWTTFGYWSANSSATTRSFGSFVTGYKTPVASIPTTGTATYNGKTIGMAYYPAPSGIFLMSLYGDASLQANFGTGNVTGSLTNMNGGAWNNVSLAGSITGGVNAFSGTAAVTSTPGGAGTLNSTGAGNFVGMFFGPGAEELGAVWNLFDGTVTATGAFGAEKTP